MAVVQFDYVFEFSGATAPAGSAPWLTATFDDGGTSGSVVLTLSASGLTGTEFVSAWYFNVDPFANLTSITQTSTDPLATISIGEDGFKADGDGLFDFKIDFAANAFTSGDTAVFAILGTGLLAGAFSAVSALMGGPESGGLLAAAHVQSIGIDGEDSGWVAAIPIPAALPLFLAALAGLGLVARRRWIAS